MHKVKRDLFVWQKRPTNTSIPACMQGFVAMYATMASNDVDICLIPEAPFSIDKLCKAIGDKIDEKGHCLIVIAEVC